MKNANEEPTLQSITEILIGIQPGPKKGFKALWLCCVMKLQW